MILHLDPGTPLVLRAAAAMALGLHVGGASLAILSGSVAVIARKADRLHRVAGTVFFGSMLTMSGVAAVVAPLLPDRFSALMGVFAFYLTATAWAVVRRRPGVVGRFETAAAFAPLVVGVLALALARIGATMPGAMLDGEPSQLGYALAVLAGIAAVSDFRMIRKGGLSGAPRIARHLWRMCLALFIAVGSAVGQPKVVALLPKVISHSALLLFTPALTILALMVFWLIRVRIPRRPRAKPQILATA